MIRYNISVFSASERMKELKKKNGKNTYMKLHAEEPFDTWKAQLLVRIDRTLSPTTLDIMHYEVNFSVPRIQPSPMAVSQEEEYTDMVECASKSKECICTIYVQELQALTKKVCLLLYDTQADSDDFYSFYCRNEAKRTNQIPWMREQTMKATQSHGKLKNRRNPRHGYMHFCSCFLS